MTAALRIEVAQDAVSRIAAGAFRAADRHPITGSFGRAYYPAVHGVRAENRAFAVLSGERPLLYTPATVTAGRVDHFGMPLRLFIAEASSAELRTRAVEAAFAHIDGIVAEAAPRGVAIETEASAVLCPVAVACLGRACRAAPRITAMIDLTAGEAARRAALRKSFRALVNWGRRSLTLVHVNRLTPDREAFARYQQFHHRVAGRVTRPQESWNAMFDAIAGGGGELTLGHLDDGTLVSATLVVDGEACAYYASGVYDRERFDKPLAHWPLWNAIARAEERGMEAFDLGEVPLPGTASDKEVAIGYFKRGFAMSLHATLVWTQASGETARC
ncbi:MAG: GNAT family N-acetyltransferase [Acetobacteraceae bacterium]|jgi:hypothetical protein|nr:GNAT family N-acetyltransferase [Acetobacteraceae bacterium]